MTKRATRPEPERERPDRNVARLIGAAGETGAGGLSDAISRTVGIGYRIVEEYLDQSRGVAAQVSPKTGAGGGAAGDGMPNVADLTARMVRTTADLFEMWFQFWDISQTLDSRAAGPASGATGSPATGGAAAAAGNGGPAATGAPGAATTHDPGAAHGASTAQEPVTPHVGAAATAALATRVTVRLASSRPASVSVDLRPVRAGAPLVLHALRAADAVAGRIDDVSITASDGTRPATVEIRVRDGQAPAVYNGMIIDGETSVAVGTVSVVVGE